MSVAIFAVASILNGSAIADPRAKAPVDDKYHETLLCRYTAGTGSSKINGIDRSKTEKPFYLRITYYPRGSYLELRVGWNAGYRYSSHSVYKESTWPGIRFLIDDRKPTLDDETAWGFYQLDFETGMLSHEMPIGVNRPVSDNGHAENELGFCQRLSPVLEHFEEMPLDADESR